MWLAVLKTKPRWDSTVAIKPIILGIQSSPFSSPSQTQGCLLLESGNRD